MTDEYRSMFDRDALAVGVRVQLSWVKYAPYTQRADLTVEDRLGTVVERLEDGWIVRDDSGENHRLLDTSLAAHEPDPAHGRWRIEGAIPAYGVGECLELQWRHRGMHIPKEPRENCWATVIEAHEPRFVRARLDDGTEIVLHRFGAQADAINRRVPRWFVIRRGDGK